MACGNTTTRELSWFVAGLRLMLRRLIVRSVAGCHDWSCDRSPDANITVRSVTWLHDWSHDRSSDTLIDRTIGRLSPPQVVRWPTTDHAIDRLQSLVIARPRAGWIAKDHSQYAASTGHRSRHCRSVASWQTTVTADNMIGQGATDRQCLLRSAIAVAYCDWSLADGRSSYVWSYTWSHTIG